MKIAVIDISGKIPYYDHALCAELKKLPNCEITLFTPYQQEEYKPTYKVKRLYSFPLSKNKKLRRIIKGFEGLINYVYLIIYFMFNNISIIHLQWLPFLEFCGVEKLFLSIFDHTNNAKIVLTVHNIYPHNMEGHRRQLYVKRFRDCAEFIDVFVVHNNSSKLVLKEDFKIIEGAIEVIYHGIFVPEVYPKSNKNSNKINLLMYGNQSIYKGTDLFIEAIELLPKEEKEKITVTIAGKTEQYLYQTYIKRAENLNIKWLNRYLTDDELNQLIANSDMLFFPYREISQSGALLLALAFRKQLVVSCLPSFTETLEGFPPSSFVDVGSANALASNIIKRLRGEIDVESELSVMDALQNKYSWSESAKKTLKLYLNLNIK